LKTDTEKVELDILQGIETKNWSLIRQIVVDVHNIDNRLETVPALLHDNGLKKLTGEQPPSLHGSTIFIRFRQRARKQHTWNQV
jgi:hypothetical protein